MEYLIEKLTVKDLLLNSVNKIGIDVSKLKYENGRIYVDDPNEILDVKSNWVRKGKRVY